MAMIQNQWARMSKSLQQLHLFLSILVWGEEKEASLPGAAVKENWLLHCKERKTDWFTKKKTAVKNSALSAAGIGKAAKKKKPSALTSAPLKPKQERTLTISLTFKSIPDGPV
jgi:hypothetical protein